MRCCRYPWKAELKDPRGPVVQLLRQLIAAAARLADPAADPRRAVDAFVRRLLQRKYEGVYAMAELPPYPCPTGEALPAGTRQDVASAIAARAAEVEQLLVEHIDPIMR